MSRKKRVYDESSIRALNYPENIINSPEMYIGTTDEDGIVHCFREIFDNATDEVRESGGKRILVVALESWIFVQDDGRGIPTGASKDMKGQSTLTTIFTHLHAGGKTVDTGAYQSARGTHGVGAAVVNALASSMTIWSHRNGWHRQEFSKGKAKTKVVKSHSPKRPPQLGKEPPSFKQGSAVCFIPDIDVFGKAKINYEKIHDIVRTAAYFLPGVTFELITHKDTAKGVGIAEYRYKTKGLADFLPKLAEDAKAELVSDIFSYEKDDCRIALAWTDQADEMSRSYVSGGLTEFGGTHQKALDSIIMHAMKDVGGRAAAKLQPKFFKSGIVSVLDVSIHHPKFDSQTKSRLTSKEATEIVGKALPDLVKYFKSNKQTLKMLLERAAKLQENEHAFKVSAAAAAKLKSPRGKVLLPVKLAVSSTKQAGQRELFILEGDSAGGTAKAARDPKFQEVLPLRGKFTNPYKSTDANVFKDESILSIFQAVGFNPAADNPLENLRVGRIFFLSDADEDGQHINAMLAGLFARYMPQLFEKRMVYVVRAPLFRGTYKDKEFYGSSLKEIQKKAGRTTGLNVTRFKGWGEASRDALNNIAFNLNTRRVIRLKPVTSKMRLNIEATIGKDTSTRRELLGLGQDQE